MATDLYRHGLTGPLLKKPLFQSAVRWGLLFLLVAGVVIGWGRETLPGVADPFPLIYTHASTLLFWVVWFMGLVLLVPLLGRAWCGVCPLGFISERLGRIGFNIAPSPGWTAKLGILVVFSVGAAAAIFFDAHKSPQMTALLIAGMTGLTVVSALVWRRAFFCSHLCPVGLTLGIYGRFSPVKIASHDPEQCSRCTTKGCVARKSSWKRWDAGSLVVHKKVYESGCPVALYPPKMDGSQCLLCMECVRNCPEGNLGVFYGKRTSVEGLEPVAVLLLVSLGGLVSLALVRTWPDLGNGLTPTAYPPVWLWALWLGFLLPAFAVFAGPLVDLFSNAVKGREEEPPEIGSDPERAMKAANREGFWGRAARMVAPLAGPVLGGHLALALVKLNAKVTFVPYIFYDPFGESTYMAINVAKTLTSPDLLIPLEILRYVAPVLLLGGIALGIFDARRFWRGRGIAVVAGWGGFIWFTALYGATLIHWLFAGR